MNLRYFILFLLFLYVVCECDWNKTWKGICFNPSGNDFYELENSFDKFYIQNNLIDCKDESCKLPGMYAPGNGTIKSIVQNGTYWDVNYFPDFWGFKPTNEKEANDIQTIMFMEFGIDFGFPINQTTWIDCQNTLGIEEITIQFQQADKNCTQIEFIGQLFQMQNGIQYWVGNPTACLMKTIETNKKES